MTQTYSNPEHKSDPHSLPDIEVFYKESGVNWQDGEYQPIPAGWYWWACFPGCLPDSDPIGPFDTESAAIEDSQLNNG